MADEPASDTAIDTAALAARESVVAPEIFELYVGLCGEAVRDTHVEVLRAFAVRMGWLVAAAEGEGSAATDL